MRPAPIEFTYVGMSGSQANTCPLPAGAAVGDFSVVLSAVTAGTITGTDAPTGYTLVHSKITVDSVQDSLAYTVLSSTANVTGGIVSTSTTRRMVLVFRPSKAITTVTPFSGAANGVSGVPAQQTVDVTGQTPPAIAIMSWHGGTSPTPGGTLISVGGTQQYHPNTTVCGMAYNIMNTSLASKTANLTTAPQCMLISSGFAFI